MPATAALIGGCGPGIAAVVSGAGPSVLALTVGGTGPGLADVTRIATQAGPAWRVLELSVDAEGAKILPR